MDYGLEFVKKYISCGVLVSGLLMLVCEKACLCQTQVESDGTVLLQRTIPLPTTISPEARELLRTPPFVPSKPLDTTTERRAFAQQFQEKYGAEEAHDFPVTIDRSTIGGVPIRLIRPQRVTNHDTRILINLHGGGFTVDSGSLTENIAVANLTGITVVAVLYRLAPEHPFPAAVEDAVAVYREMLKTRSAADIGLYGTSAGAILTMQTCVRLRTLKLPLPAALGFFSGTADLASVGETEHFFSTEGLRGDPQPIQEYISSYLQSNDLRDPAVSPIFADLKGFPPTLCISGTRDDMLSQTTLFQRALLRAGVDARLVVFEAMPHAHWSFPFLPESKEAFSIMAQFFNTHVGRTHV